MSFEESLVWHASPTLASIKVANLYTFNFLTLDECQSTLQQFNLLMNPKGIYIELLKKSSNLYLIYVYRKAQLLKELQNKEVQNFLRGYGYNSEEGIHNYLGFLKKRLKEGDEFPHEIGVFLGYPLMDVKSFIETKGQNCKLCGEWKVYHNEQSARGLFIRYRHCRDIYVKVYGEGRKLKDMLVGA